MAGRERLRLLSAAMRPLTEAFLDRLNITHGMRCLDVGCGGGDVTRLLAQRCGATGSVVGIDSDAVVLGIAREETAAGLGSNSDIEYVHADAIDYDMKGRFDLVYARFFLSHVTDARATLKHLRGLLRPGGTLAIEDVWFPGHFCFPRSEAFDTFVQWYREAAQGRGADPDLGIKLPNLFEELSGDLELGFTHVRSEMHTQAFGAGANKFVSLITLERIRASIVEASVASEAEVVRVIEELRAYTERSDTIVSMAPVMQICARVKP